MSDSSHTPTNIDAIKPHQTLLEARRPLKEDIEKLISPYRHDSDQKPPFKGYEIAIMAIISSPTEYMDEDNMVWWTMENFAFYKLGSCYSVRLFLFDRISRDWISRNYDVPIIKKLGNYSDPSECLDAYTIKPDVARLCLRDHLEPKREGTFRFFDLPAELRNRIYSMLLDFSDAEITVDRLQDGLHSNLRCRACVSQTSQTQEHTWWCKERIVEIGICNSVGRLFLVSRQVRSETLPIFYSTNVFRLQDLWNAGDLLHGLSANQLKYIKKVHMNMHCLKGWEYNSYLDLAKLNTALAFAARGFNKLLPLEEVTFTIDDFTWVSMWSNVHSYDDVTGLPGLLEVVARANIVKVFQSRATADCKVFNSLVQKAIESRR